MPLSDARKAKRAEHDAWVAKTAAKLFPPEYQERVLEEGRYNLMKAMTDARERRLNPSPIDPSARPGHSTYQLIVERGD